MELRVLKPAFDWPSKANAGTGQATAGSGAGGGKSGNSAAISSPAERTSLVTAAAVNRVASYSMRRVFAA